MRIPTTLLAATLLLLQTQAQDFHCGTNELHRLGASSISDAELAERIAQNDLQLEEFTRSFQESDARGGESYVIPVVFHIIHNNGPENISDAQVFDAMRVLNNDFNRLNPDWDNVRPEFQSIVADVGFEFRLATRDPNGNCTNGITRTVSPLTNEGAEQMKALITWPRNKYMQIWVAASADGAAGYTFTPGTAQMWPTQDGIVMQHTYVGAIGTSSTGRSRSLTHEVGHWLNLSHTWGSSNTPAIDSNCAANMTDNVDDTPKTRGWTTCTLGGASCGSPLDNVENYMEYSYCSKMFTEGQKSRMVAALNSSTAQRNQLWQTSNLINTGVNGNASLCAATFISNTTEICAGGSVVYTDQSYHNVSSRTWSFPGGSPSTSTEAMPTVTYATGGSYPVTLTVSDGAASITATRQNVISVLDVPGRPVPFSESFETATQPADIGWRVNNPDGDNGYTISNAAAFTGTKSIRLLNTAGMAGRIDQLFTPTMDLSGATEINLSFRYAYARRTATSADQLRVFVSNNCGQTWSLRGQLFATSDLNTGGVVTGNFVPNGPSQWGYKEITTINSTFHVSNMRIRFDFGSEGGNNFYLDDININGMPVGLAEYDGVEAMDMRVVPNPVGTTADLLISLERTEQTRIELLDVLGRTLNLIHDGTMVTGDHRIALPMGNVPPGVYIVRITRAEGAGSIRVVKE